VAKYFPKGYKIFMTPEYIQIVNANFNFYINNYSICDNEVCSGLIYESN